MSNEKISQNRGRLGVAEVFDGEVDGALNGLRQFFLFYFSVYHVKAFINMIYRLPMNGSLLRI